MAFPPRQIPRDRKPPDLTIIAGIPAGKGKPPAPMARDTAPPPDEGEPNGEITCPSCGAHLKMSLHDMGEDEGAETAGGAA